jgi:5'-nucleotidase
MKRILLVNDDGYQAAGIRALQREMAKTYNVTAVAPAHEQSWMGKSISGHRGLTLEPVEFHEFKGYAADGTPADCTQLGLYALDQPLPDLVLSGVNHGANIGHAHIMSSGTVGAAFEAAFQGVPAFATSVWQVKRNNKDVDFNAPESVEIFANAAVVTRKIVDKVMAAGFPKRAQVIAINMPHNVTSDAEWVVTKPHTIAYGQLFALQDGKYHNTGSTELQVDQAPDSDLAALAKGYVSIVPISLRLTSDEGRAELADILGVRVFG